MTSEDVASTLGRAADRRWPAPYAGGIYELFRPMLLRVQYDPEGRAGSFEFGGRDPNTVDLVYDNLHLFGTAALQVFAWAVKEDPDLEIESGFVSRKLGLAMYAPMLSVLNHEDSDDSEDGLPAQACSVFRRGLYEEQDALIARFNAEGK